MKRAKCLLLLILLLYNFSVDWASNINYSKLDFANTESRFAGVEKVGTRGRKLRKKETFATERMRK